VKGKDLVVVEVSGEKVTVPGSCYEISLRKEKVSGRKVVPHVIEPSYGVDRILFAVLDHSYAINDDYVTLRLRGLVAPIKAGVFPLMPRDDLDTIALEIHESLAEAGYPSYYDDSGSIGRRYARMDEVGTPCCITVDYDTKTDGCVTIRERDTANQIRVRKEEAHKAVEMIVGGASLESLTKKK
jgi:glycyl-tRNA synthetase